MIPITTYVWTEPLTVSDRAEIERRRKASGLKVCQASHGDGECIHQRCPNADLKIPGGNCPLPWDDERD